MQLNHIITPPPLTEKSILHAQGGKVFGGFFSLLSYFIPPPPHPFLYFAKYISLNPFGAIFFVGGGVRL